MRMEWLNHRISKAKNWSPLEMQWISTYYIRAKKASGQLSWGSKVVAKELKIENEGETTEWHKEKYDADDGKDRPHGDGLDKLVIWKDLIALKAPKVAD